MSIDPRRVASFLFQYNYYSRGLNAGDSRAVAAADRAYGDKVLCHLSGPPAAPASRRAPPKMRDPQTEAQPRGGAGRFEARVETVAEATTDTRVTTSRELDDRASARSALDPLEAATDIASEPERSKRPSTGGSRPSGG